MFVDNRNPPFGVAFGVVEYLIAGEEPHEPLTVELTSDSVEKDIPHWLGRLGCEVRPDRLLQSKPTGRAHYFVLYKTVSSRVHTAHLGVTINHTSIVPRRAQQA